MATTAEFRNGLCINHNGEPWKIESFQHVKPGKGAAFVRCKIKNFLNLKISFKKISFQMFNQYCPYPSISKFPIYRN